MKLSYELLVCCFAYLGISSVCSVTEGGYVFSPCTDKHMLSSSRCLLQETEVERECECQSLCDGDDNCVFMFYNPDTKKCRLYDQHEDQIVTAGMECARIVDCGIPAFDDSMNVTYTNTAYGSVAEIECAVGYVLTTEGMRSVCQESGEWSNPTGVCEVVDCGTPVLAVNMVADQTSTTYGSVTKIKCAPAYNSNTEDIQSECQASGKWSDPTGDCKLVSVPSCTRKAECVFLRRSHCYGGVCRCDIGYGIDGVTCRSLTGCTAYADTFSVYGRLQAQRVHFKTASRRTLESCQTLCLAYTTCKFANFLSENGNCALVAISWNSIPSYKIYNPSNNNFKILQRDCMW